MTMTRTPGIAVGADGRYFIDKRYRGIRIGIIGFHYVRHYECVELDM